MGVSLAREITTDSLFDDGFAAVFLALGSIKCLLSPASVQTDAGASIGLTCVRNEHGNSSGRREDHQ